MNFILSETSEIQSFTIASGSKNYTVILKQGGFLEGLNFSSSEYLQKVELISLNPHEFDVEDQSIIIDSSLIPDTTSLNGRIHLLGNTHESGFVDFIGAGFTQTYRWKNSQQDFYWDSQWLDFIPEIIMIRFPESVTPSITLNYRSVDEPCTVDLSTVLSNAKDNELAYRIYKWALDPSILIFDFSDYQEQAKWLKRLAFFIEKPGYRGQILTNHEIEDKHGWNAHDYSAQGLADFFNSAEGFPLNPEEFYLKEILLDHGIIVFHEGQYKAGSGAIISISHESSPILRQRFITHEAVHALFFTQQEFREAIFSYWQNLNPDFQEAWKTFLYYNNHPYDSSWTFLTVNELAGYFMQLPVTQAEVYFQYRYNYVAENTPIAAEILNPFLQNHNDPFTPVAKALENILQEYFPLFSGDFTLTELLTE